MRQGGENEQSLTDGKSRNEKTENLINRLDQAVDSNFSLQNLRVCCGKVLRFIVGVIEGGKFGGTAPVKAR